MFFQGIHFLSSQVQGPQGHWKNPWLSSIYMYSMILEVNVLRPGRAIKKSIVDQWLRKVHFAVKTWSGKCNSEMEIKIINLICKRNPIIFLHSFIVFLAFPSFLLNSCWWHHQDNAWNTVGIKNIWWHKIKKISLEGKIQSGNRGNMREILMRK